LRYATISTGPPLATYHGQQYITGPNGVFDGFDKIEARGDGINVHEEVVGAKVLTEAIQQPPRVSTTVVTPVAEENPRHNARSLKVYAFGWDWRQRTSGAGLDGQEV
jgi:hypothetical protein